MKKRYIISFPGDTSKDAIIYDLIRNKNIRINILQANIKSGEKGELLVEMEADNAHIQEGIDYLRGLHASCELLEKRIHRDDDACIHCGACTAVCFSEALYVDENAKIILDKDKCVACGLCVTACPLKLFTLDFGK